MADSLALGPVRRADLTLTAADLNLALNDYPRAADLFRQAQVDYRQANDLLGQSSALEGQGYLSIVRGDADQAVDLLERALGMQARAGDPDPRSSALTRSYLAAALEETGEVALARQTLHQALRSEQRRVGKGRRSRWAPYH